EEVHRSSQTGPSGVDVVHVEHGPPGFCGECLGQGRFPGSGPALNRHQPRVPGEGRTGTGRLREGLHRFGIQSVTTRLLVDHRFFRGTTLSALSLPRARLAEGIHGSVGRRRCCWAHHQRAGEPRAAVVAAAVPGPCRGGRWSGLSSWPTAPVITLRSASPNTPPSLPPVLLGSPVPVQYPAACCRHPRLLAGSRCGAEGTVFAQIAPVWLTKPTFLRKLGKNLAFTPCKLPCGQLFSASSAARTRSASDDRCPGHPGISGCPAAG